MRCVRCGDHAKVLDATDETNVYCLDDAEIAFNDRDLKVWRWIGGVLPHDDVSPLGKRREPL